MRLSNQMKAEIDSIKKHLDGMNPFRPLLRKQIDERKVTRSSHMYIVENAEQLSSYKAKLENLLSKTDLKERGHYANAL